MSYGIIYKAQNKINNKVYIGQTIKELEIRKKQHFYNSNINKNENKSHFKSSIEKYGFDVFEWSILDTANSFNELNFKEIFYIKYYKSTNPTYGYNLSSGGNNPILRGVYNGMYGKTHTEEAKQKIRDNMIGLTWDERLGAEKSKEVKIKLSEANLGSKRSVETKRKMSKNQWLKNKGYLISGDKNPNYGNKWTEDQKNKVSGENNGMYKKGYLISGENNGMYGKKHTEETKQKMSIKRKGKNNHRYYQIDCIEEIISFYELGYSIPFISNTFKVYKGKIRRELKEAGIKLRNVSEQINCNTKIKK